MINPWQIIGWWFILGIVAAPVFLAVWCVIDHIKTQFDEIERREREQLEQVERLERLHAELSAARTEQVSDILRRSIAQEEIKQAVEKYRCVPIIYDPKQLYNTREEADSAAIFHYNAGGGRCGGN